MTKRPASTRGDLLAGGTLPGCGGPTDPRNVVFPGLSSAPDR